MSRGLLVLYFCHAKVTHHLTHLDIESGHVGEVGFAVNTPAWVYALSPQGCQSIVAKNPAQQVLWVNDGAECWANTFFDCCDAIDETIKVSVDYSAPNDVLRILQAAAKYPQFNKFATELQNGKFKRHRHQSLVAAYATAIKELENDTQR